MILYSLINLSHFIIYLFHLKHLFFLIIYNLVSLFFNQFIIINSYFFFRIFLFLLISPCILLFNAHKLILILRYPWKKCPLITNFKFHKSFLCLLFMNLFLLYVSSKEHLKFIPR